MFAAIAVGLALLVAACGGDSRQTIRIGVISDCQGPFAPYYEQSLAGAELPFIQRGARLRGTKPSDGVEAISLGSTRVELVPGCERYGSPRTTLSEARRLVEQEGANAVVAPFWYGDGLAISQYARVQPGIVFSDASFEPQATLDRPAHNVFRFNLDAAQSIAGLGAYAYHVLGWRKVVTLGEDDPSGWPVVGGFVAEFCALGGNVVKRLWAGGVNDWRPVLAQIPRAGVDGVLYANQLQDPAGFFTRYGRRHPDLARRVIVSGLALVHTSRLTPRLLGIVGSWDNPFGTTVAAWDRYVHNFQRAFKDPNSTILPRAAAVNFYNATEARAERTRAGARRSLPPREPTDGGAARPPAREPEGPASGSIAIVRRSAPPFSAELQRGTQRTLTDPDVRGRAGGRADLQRIFRSEHAGGERDRTAPAGMATRHRGLAQADGARSDQVKRVRLSRGARPPGRSPRRTSSAGVALAASAPRAMAESLPSASGQTGRR